METPNFDYPKTSDYYKVYFFAVKWIKTRMLPFTNDDLKTDFLKENDEIEKVNSYGLVFKHLCKEGLIKFNHKYVKSKFPKAKGRDVKQWVSFDYSELQSKKRLSENTEKSRIEAKKQLALKV